MFGLNKNTSEALWNGLKVEFGKIYNNRAGKAFKPMHELEMPGGKKLRVFDFDDTIVKTNSFVYVKHKDGKESKLNPGEYAVYEPKPGDQFDFSDFQKVTQPQEIRGVTKILKRIAAAEGERKLVILTARSAYKPIKDYLSDIGLEGIYVVALADSDPQKKADWIEDKIKKGYDDVYFIDDSHKNVAAVGDLKKKYPEAKIRVQKVKHDTPSAPKAQYKHGQKVKGENIKSLKSFIPEEKVTDPEFTGFAEKRMGGAAKISADAKEKGGPAILTYHHFIVKLPYYKKAKEGKIDLDDMRAEYKDLLEQLYSATKGDMAIEQIAFQELVGKIEVLGELIIKEQNK